MNEISSAEIKRMRKVFERELDIYYSHRHGKPEWDKKRIKDVIKKVEEPSMGSSWYYYQNKYEVKLIDGEKVLINKNKQSDTIVKIAPSENYFDILLEAHLETGHGGRDKMLGFLKNSAYVPSTIIALFPKHCKVCKTKKVAKKPRTVLFRNAGPYKRGLIHIVDMTNTPCESYNYIMYYQDQHTKFCLLRPLTNESPDAIAQELTKIFLDLGPPAILTSTRNNRDFITAIVHATNFVCPGNILVVGKLIDPKEGDERDSCIRTKIEKWMSQRNSKRWSLGIHFVQFELNTTFDEELDTTPYTCMFGYPPKMGIDTTGIPSETAKKMKDEKDYRDWQLFINRTSNREKVKSMHNSSSEGVHGTFEDGNSSAADNDTTTDPDRDWCWVCEQEDDAVTSLCSSCNGTIHKTCGKNKNESVTDIECFLCLRQHANSMPRKDGKIEIKVEPVDTDEKPETFIEVSETSIGVTIKKEEDS